MSVLTYVFIVFSETYINLVKYLQRVPSIGCILHQDAGKTYSKISKMRSHALEIAQNHAKLR